MTILPSLTRILKQRQQRRSFPFVVDWIILRNSGFIIDYITAMQSCISYFSDSASSSILFSSSSSSRTTGLALLCPLLLFFCHVFLSASANSFCIYSVETMNFPNPLLFLPWIPTGFWEFVWNYGLFRFLSKKFMMVEFSHKIPHVKLLALDCSHVVVNRLLVRAWLLTHAGLLNCLLTLECSLM